LDDLSLGVARLGRAGLGKARRGAAWLGSATQDKVSTNFAGNPKKGDRE